MKSRFGSILLLLLLLQLTEVKAQFVIAGKIVDKELGKPIPQVNIVHKAGNKKAESDEFGNFRLEVADKKCTISFSHIAFRDTSVNLKPALWQSDSIFMYVRLDYDLVQISTATVSSEKLPEVIYSNDSLHVGDYLFLNEDLLLLTYEKEDRWKRQEQSKITPFSNCALVLQDSSGKEILKHELNGEYVALERTYNDEVLLHSIKKHYLLKNLIRNLNLTEIDENTYNKAFVPVLDSLKQFILLSDYSADFPSFSYYAYHTKDSIYSEIRKIEDELQMELLRSEYKYLPSRGKLDAFRLELKTGIDKEIIAAWMTGFSESLYAESLYAPCLVINDTLCIFNHYNDFLFKHAGSTSQSDSIKFDYHKENAKGKWKRELLHDEVMNKVFVQYDKHGYTYICEFNITNGTLGEAYRLRYRYPEKVRVRNNKVYYLYRPFSSAQKHYLYSEDLQ